MIKPKQVMFTTKDVNISLTISADGVKILTDRGNKIDTMFLYWNEWDKIVAAVKEAIKENEKARERE